MQRVYQKYNEEAQAKGSKGHFMVDLSRPGHLTACLRTFQEAVSGTDENWDASFGGWCCNTYWLHHGEMVCCPQSWHSGWPFGRLGHMTPPLPVLFLPRVYAYRLVPNDARGDEAKMAFTGCL